MLLRLAFGRSSILLQCLDRDLISEKHERKRKPVVRGNRRTEEHSLCDSVIASRKCDVIYRPRTISTVVHRDSGKFAYIRGPVDGAKLQSSLRFCPEVAGHDRHGEAVLNGFHKSRLLIWCDYDTILLVNAQMIGIGLAKQGKMMRRCQSTAVRQTRGWGFAEVTPKQRNVTYSSCHA